MKKALSISVFTAAVLMVGASLAGVGPSYVLNSPKMLTGMSAKLACSGRYVSGLSQEQAFIDLQSYSPLLKLVDLDFDDESESVAASLLGIKTTEAKYRAGLGCALSIGDTDPLDSVEISASQVSNLDWPLGQGNSHINPVWQQSLAQRLEQDNLEGLNTRALLVIKKGQLVAESYAPGFHASSKLLGWSMAKSVTSLLLGHLEMQGQLDFSRKPVFSQWSDDARATISIDNLLHMSSGLDFPETYEPGAGATDMLFAEYHAAELPLAAAAVRKPGEYFEYSSGTTNLLSKLIYEASGATPQSNANFLRKTLVEPLKLKDFIFETDPSGMSVGSSYLYASAREWAKFGQLMLNGGELNGYRLVSEDWVARALQPNLSDNTKSYGYQFWLNNGDDSLRWKDLPRESFAALGNRKQVVMVIPSQETVIVRLGWTSGGYPTSVHFSEILSFLQSDSPSS